MVAERDFIYYSVPHNKNAFRKIWRSLSVNGYKKIEEPNFEQEGFYLKEVEQDDKYFY
jgi:hypothetical protein